MKHLFLIVLLFTLIGNIHGHTLDGPPTSDNIELSIDANDYTIFPVLELNSSDEPTVLNYSYFQEYQNQIFNLRLKVYSKK